MAAAVAVAVAAMLSLGSESQLLPTSTTCSLQPRLLKLLFPIASALLPHLLLPLALMLQL